MMGEHGRLTLWQKIKMWASDKWNVWDLVGVLLYIPGFALRLYSVAGFMSVDEPYARILFSLDVMVWYIRLLDVCSVNNVMGPYVNMIGRMVCVHFSLYQCGVSWSSSGVVRKPECGFDSR